MRKSKNRKFDIKSAIEFHPNILERWKLRMREQINEHDGSSCRLLDIGIQDINAAIDRNRTILFKDIQYNYNKRKCYEIIENLENAYRSFFTELTEEKLQIKTYSKNTVETYLDNWYKYTVKLYVL